MKALLARLTKLPRPGSRSAGPVVEYLPDADEITFTITGSKVHFGDADWSKRSRWVSGRLIGHTDTLLRVLAHEMAHFRADAQGETAVHGRLWHRAVRSICREHGWDAKAL